MIQKKKWLAALAVLVLVLSLTSGVVGAESVNNDTDFEEEYRAAPAVAGELLEEAGIDNRYGTGRDGGNYIRDVAHEMGPGTDFDEVCKTDVDAYRKAVALFLRSKGADVGADIFEARLESVVYEGICDKFGSHIGDTLTFTFSNDVFHDPNIEVTFETAQELWEGWGADDWTFEGNTATVKPNRLYGNPRDMVDDKVIDITGMIDAIGNPAVIPEDGVDLEVNSVYPTTEWSGTFTSTRDVPGEWSYDVTIARDCDNSDIVWAEVTLTNPEGVAIQTTVEDTKEDYDYWLQWNIQPNIAAVGTATYGEYEGNFMFLFADNYVQMLLSGESYDDVWDADGVWSGEDRDYDIWASGSGFMQ